MVVRNLANTSFDDIISCFLSAFENYYVEMPQEKSYYEERWAAAGVDFNFSYGMFDKEKLVGFIIHAVDVRFGKLTAFNTGTGVLKQQRGNRIIKAIYNVALGDLKKNNFEICSLEVIQKNNIAVTSYESIGFKKVKKYYCYSGELFLDKRNDLVIEKLIKDQVEWDMLPNQKMYSWDFQKETIIQKDYEHFYVLFEGRNESYFSIDLDSKCIAQFDVLDVESLKNVDAWNRLFSAISSVSRNIRIINVDDRQREKIDFIESLELTNTVNQFEMVLDI